MNAVKKVLITKLLVAGIFGGYSISSIAEAQSDAASSAENGYVQPAAESENGVTYISGGIGEDEVQSLKRQAKDYDLKLTFATKRAGAFLADVKVEVQDAKGNTVLDTTSNGPIFLANLPKGNYKVIAEAEGKKIVQPVHITGRNSLVQKSFTWPDKLVSSPAPVPDLAQSEASNDGSSRGSSSPVQNNPDAISSGNSIRNASPVSQ